MPVPWTHLAALSVSHASCSSHFKRIEFHFNESLAASYPLIFLKRRFREEKFGICFFSFRSFQDVSRYTDTSGLNLQVMSQLGLMTCSGLVTSTSGSIRIARLWIPSWTRTQKQTCPSCWHTTSSSVKWAGVSDSCFSPRLPGAEISMHRNNYSQTPVS